MGDSQQSDRDLYIREHVAYIDRAIAETRRRQEETSRFVDEQHRLIAETSRRQAEANRLQCYGASVPWVAVFSLASMVVAIFAAGVAFASLIR